MSVFTTGGHYVRIYYWRPFCPYSLMEAILSVFNTGCHSVRIYVYVTRRETYGEHVTGKLSGSQ